MGSVGAVGTDLLNRVLTGSSVISIEYFFVSARQRSVRHGNFIIASTSFRNETSDIPVLSVPTKFAAVMVSLSRLPPSLPDFLGTIPVNGRGRSQAHVTVILNRVITFRIRDYHV